MNIKNMFLYFYKKNIKMFFTFVLPTKPTAT